MSENKIAYLEFTATNIPATKQFYADLFGWTFEDWGPDYVAFANAGLDGGFNAVPEQRTKAPLAVIQTSRIEAMETKIREAGATITVPTFAYPGGRRFHFLDPNGNELAIMQPDS